VALRRRVPGRVETANLARWWRFGGLNPLWMTLLASPS
jgi:hypothetical protein